MLVGCRVFREVREVMVAVMVAWCVIRLMRMYLFWERVDYLQLPVAMVYGLKLEPSTHASCVLGGTAKWPVAQDSLSPCVGMKPA